MSAPLPRARLTPAPVGDRVIAGAIDLVTCGLVVAALGLFVGMFVDSTVLAWVIAVLVVAVPREIALAITGWSPGGRLRRVVACCGGAPVLGPEYLSGGLSGDPHHDPEGPGLLRPVGREE